MYNKEIRLLSDIPIRDGTFRFDRYCEVLANAIRNANPPRFTIGIFGTWGTGKTTLMQMIKDSFSVDETIVLVWFNAWRYEKEEHLIIPLLQIVRMALKEREKAFSQLYKTIGSVLYALAYGLSFQVGGVGLSAKDCMKKAKELEELTDKQSLYYQIVRDLETAVQGLRLENPHFRIVVFIDDLDRCSPDRVLQVLESIKLFLDIDGFIFVLGLDRTVIEDAIDRKYGPDSKVKGSDYIRKIIQVPFPLPALSTTDIENYVQDILDYLKEMDLQSDIRIDLTNIVPIVAERNPREVKRFINSFFIALEIREPELDPGILLALRGLQFRWRDLYRTLEAEGASFLQQLANSEEGTMLADPALSVLFETQGGKRLLEFKDVELIPYMTFSAPVEIPVVEDQPPNAVQQGTIAQVKGEWEKAEKYFQDAVANPETEFSDKAVAIRRLGQVAEQAGNLDEARNYYNSSLEMERQIGNQPGILVSLQNMGRVAETVGDLEHAIRLYSESLDLGQKLGDQVATANLYQNLGVVKYKQKEYEEARRLLEESLRINQELGDEASTATTLYWLGRVEQTQGDYETARSHLQRSLEIYQRLNIADKAEVIQKLLAVIEDSK